MSKNTKVTDAKIMYAVLVMLNSRGPLSGSEIKEHVLEALITRTDYKKSGYLKSKKQVGTQEHIWEITDKGVEALEMVDIDLYEQARLESKAQYDAKEQIMPIYRFENLKDVRQNPGLSSGHGESIKGERMYFCHRIWEAGTEAKPHYHACEQFIYIMRGRQKFTMGGEEYELGPGDVIHIPANEVHAAEMIEEVEAIYVKDTTWSLKGVAAGEAAPDAPPPDDPF